MQTLSEPKSSPLESPRSMRFARQRQLLLPEYLTNAIHLGYERSFQIRAVHLSSAYDS